MMNSSKEDMLGLVDGVRNSVGVRRFLFIFILGLVAGAILVIVASYFLDSTLTREDQQFNFLIGAFLFVSLIWLKGIFDFFSKRLTRQDIALKVESEVPELMDSYICALEIEEKGGPQSRIEEALTRSVKQRFVSGEISSLVTPKYLRTPLLFTLFTFCGILLLSAFGSGFSQNAMNHAKSQSSPILAGIEVKPGNVRVPRGEDLTIEATIKRGEQAAQLEYKFDGEWLQQEMIEEGGKFSATLYGVAEDGQYRIITPNVKSEAYEIVTFLKPQFKALQIKVNPPEYTGKKPFIVKDIRDVAVPAGSAIDFTVSANKKVIAYFVEGEERTAFSDQAYVKQSFSLIAEKSIEYTLVLQDSEKNEVKSKTVKLNVVDDMPPHLEVIKPGKDTRKSRFDILDVEVNAIDDYGLATVDLHLEYSFGTREKFKIFKNITKKAVREKNSLYSLELKELGLKEGDVIAYYFSASDNHQPIPQVSRSKIFFLEIRPDKSTLQDEEKKEQEGEQQKKFKVTDLINDQKDLSRKIIDTRMKSSKVKGNSL